MTDSSLIVAAKSGDGRAARDLFERHVGVVMSYCVLSTGYDRDRAKDLTQETFLRAFRALGNLRNEDAFRPWVMTIAKNVCRSAGSEQTNWRQLLDELGEETDLKQGDLRDQRHKTSIVREVLDSLPDSQAKKMAIMKYTEPEHTTREIAEALGVPHGTVTVTLMRFREQIKERLMDALKDSNGGNA